MAENFAHWIIRWRYLVVLAVIGAVFAAGAGMPKLSLSNDYRMFFGEDNPQLLEFERMQNTFNKNDNIMFVVTPEDGQVFSVKTLKAIQAITEAAWQIPFSTRVDSITNFQHTRAEDDDLIVDDLVVDPETLSADDLSRIQTIAINEPMMVHRLISPDSGYTGINVNMQLPGKSLSEVPEAMAYARTGPFMGSEFFFEDISSQEIEKYTYKYLRDEVLNGIDCFVIERVPTYEHSGYTRQVGWINKAEYRAEKIVFYDRKNSLLKTLNYSGYKKYLDQYWRADQLLMENHQNEKSTVLNWNNYKFKTGLSDNDFSRNSLKRAK